MNILPRRRKDTRSAPEEPGTEAGYPLTLSGERIPSHIASVFFTVRIDGVWRLMHDAPLDHHDPTTLARHHLRQEAARVLGRYSVLQLAAAQDAANTTVMRWHRPAAGLEVTGAVQLAATARDRDLAEEHARRQQASDLEHEDQRRRLAHLQQVLADPDLRRVWWMDRFPDRYTELTALAEKLKSLPLPHEPGNDDTHSDIQRFTDQFLTALHTPQQRELFLRVLSQTLTALGQHDLATATAHWHIHTDPGRAPA
ncbi:hypothetical protein [Streptomyces sp. NPDC052701]|uniref:hypothetical protein n=1 Tax=Streptomyces sp. NPDC052701 TaxID=3155533 RepID=UPI003421DCF6